MSASKLEKDFFKPVVLESGHTRLNLAPESVSFRKSGIEFLSPTPLAPYTEMTVELESPRDAKRVACTGIVVACEGSRQAGYVVSLLLTGLNRQSQAQLSRMAYANA